jgi:hypothetical protein
MMDRRLIAAASTFAVVLAGCASGETPGAPAVSTRALTAAESDAGEAPGDDAGTAGPSNDCCSTSGSGGCSDEAVAACVCQGDPFCCSNEYDALCVNQAVSRCGQDCDDRPPVSDCCSASSVPGCTDAPVAACVCEIDPFCCVFRFDQSCVNLGVSRCNLSCGEEEPVP